VACIQVGLTSSEFTENCDFTQYPGASAENLSASVATGSNDMLYSAQP
jgi:hypothetical protein